MDSALTLAHRHISPLPILSAMAFRETDTLRYLIGLLDREDAADASPANPPGARPAVYLLTNSGRLEVVVQGNYREAFPEDITGSTRLNGNWSEEELDSFGAELPMVILDALNTDLDAARHEAASGSHAKNTVTAAPTEQAAS